MSESLKEPFHPSGVGKPNTGLLTKVKLG